MARYGFLFVFLMNNVSFFQLPGKSPTSTTLTLLNQIQEIG